MRPQLSPRGDTLLLERNKTFLVYLFGATLSRSLPAGCCRVSDSPSRSSWLEKLELFPNTCLVGFLSFSSRQRRKEKYQHRKRDVAGKEEKNNNREAREGRKTKHGGWDARQIIYKQSCVSAENMIVNSFGTGKKGMLWPRTIYLEMKVNKYMKKRRGGKLW